MELPHSSACHQVSKTQVPWESKLWVNSPRLFSSGWSLLMPTPHTCGTGSAAHSQHGLGRGWKACKPAVLAEEDWPLLSCSLQPFSESPPPSPVFHMQPGWDQTPAPPPPTWRSPVLPSPRPHSRAPARSTLSRAGLPLALTPPRHLHSSSLSTRKWRPRFLDFLRKPQYQKISL